MGLRPGSHSVLRESCIRSSKRVYQPAVVGVSCISKTTLNTTWTRQPTNLSNMSHPEQDLPGITMYSDEIRMGSGNGNNGVLTLSTVVPSAIEEPEASLGTTNCFAATQ